MHSARFQCNNRHLGFAKITALIEHVPRHLNKSKTKYLNSMFSYSERRHLAYQLFECVDFERFKTPKLAVINLVSDISRYV